MPSAVRRLRSQELQKGRVVDATIPNTVPSGRRKRAAGAPNGQGTKRRHSAAEPGQNQTQTGPSDRVP